MSGGIYVRFSLNAEDIRKGKLTRISSYSGLPIKGSAQSIKDEPY